MVNYSLNPILALKSICKMHVREFIVEMTTLLIVIICSFHLNKVEVDIFKWFNCSLG
jgi:hypothetical protein